MGYFEKGKWVTGPLDGIDNKIERVHQEIRRFGESVKEVHTRFDEVLDKYGHFERGKWIRDLPFDIAENSEVRE